jgi:copper homeostasis protein
VKPTVEICVDSAEGVLAAAAGGADRVELCVALEGGGTTPSVGTLAAARERCALEIVALLRPRAGDFLYTPLELASLERDLEALRAAGADGVALGCLLPDGRVDRERTARLAERARPLKVTFHRAFDLCADLGEALATLIELGLDRVLTSGGAAEAAEGTAALRALVQQAGDSIAVVAAGGVRPQNARRIVEESGARELHATARAPLASAMRHRNTHCRLGASTGDAYEHQTTDAERVRALVRALAR